MTTESLTPTEFITGWLLSGPDFLREQATFYAGWAITGFPDESQGYLADLEAWVGQHWGVRQHEMSSQHNQALRDRLTYEEIESADWRQIAEALVAADRKNP